MGKNNWTFDDLAKKTKLPNNPALAAIEPAGMIRIDQKPLSVNEVWQGKRFKTNTYKSYEKLMLVLLPKITLPEPPYQITLAFGFSSSACDIDNPIKPILDIMQKKYGFNDKLITVLNVTKELVPKGQEYISFEIKKAL